MPIRLLTFSKWLILGIYRKNHKKHKKNTKKKKHKNVIVYVTQDLFNNNLSSFILKKNFTFIFRVCLFFCKMSLHNISNIPYERSYAIDACFLCQQCLFCDNK